MPIAFGKSDDEEAEVWFYGFLVALFESGWSVITDSGDIIVGAEVHFP